MEMLFYMLLILLSNAAPDTGPPTSSNGGSITCGETKDGIISTQGASVAYEFTNEYRSTPSTFFSFSTCDTIGAIDTRLHVEGNDGSTTWLSLVIPGNCNTPASKQPYCIPCKVDNNGEIMAADLTKPTAGHTRWVIVTAFSGSGSFKLSLNCPTTAPTRTPTIGTSAPTTSNPTTDMPTTYAPTTPAPTTNSPTTNIPTTNVPTTVNPSTSIPTTDSPSTSIPTTDNPTTIQPTTGIPTTDNSTIPNSDAPTQFPTSPPVEQSTEGAETGNGANNASENSGLTGDTLLLASIIGGCVVSFCLGILITLFCVRRRTKRKEMDALDKEIKITITNGGTDNGNTSNGTATETEMVTKKSMDLSEENDDNELDEMYGQGPGNATAGGEMNNNGKELVRLKSNESVEGNNNSTQIENEDSDDEMYKTEVNETIGQ